MHDDEEFTGSIIGTEPVTERYISIGIKQTTKSYNLETKVSVRTNDPGISLPDELRMLNDTATEEGQRTIAQRKAYDDAFGN